jgi:hypothetical protein
VRRGAVAASPRQRRRLTANSLPKPDASAGLQARRRALPGAILAELLLGAQRCDGRGGRARRHPGRKASALFTPSSSDMPDAPNASPSGAECERPQPGAEGTPEQGRRPGLASKLVDDERLLDTLADRLADRLAARLSAVESPALVDAREVAQLTGKTRRWIYDHARELGAVPLGSGPRSPSGVCRVVVRYPWCCAPLRAPCLFALRVRRFLPRTKVRSGRSAGIGPRWHQ